MVLELQERKGNAKKRIVLLDGEVYCCCYPKDLKTVGIKEGEETEEAMLKRLDEEIFLPRAKRRSLFLLNKKRYTEQEMRKKLKADGYPEAVIEEVLLYLQKLHYIEDISYAQGYATVWISKCSERELYQKMLQKGFEKEVITDAIKAAKEEYYFVNGSEAEEAEAPELAAIRMHLRKKGVPSEQIPEEKKKKLVMSLYRKGFSLSDIKKVMGDMGELSDTFEL